MQNYISATYPDGHTETVFTPLALFETPEALEKICEEYSRVIGNFEVEPLIIIPIFIHDFLCIHPFNDGNGRMSRLLTTLLLYRSGFNVGSISPLKRRSLKTRICITMLFGVRRTAGMRAAKMLFLSSSICLGRSWRHTRILRTDFPLSGKSCLLLKSSEKRP